MEQPNFKQVSNCQYSSEAHIYKGKLEASGITVYMRDNHTVDSDPMISNAIGGVKLFVAFEDYDNAVAILNEISPFSTDNFGKPVICSNCGSKKVELYSTIRDSKSFFSFVFSILCGALPFYIKYKFKCSDCKFEFDQTS